MRQRRLIAAAAFALGACASAHEPIGGYALDASYPEGPFYRADGAAFVAEMGADQISLISGARKTRFFSQNDCGPTAIAPYGDGWLVLCHRAAAVVAIDAQGREERRIDSYADGRRFSDPNDAYADGQGGVFFSDPGPFTRDVAAMGSIVQLGADGVARRVARDLWYPNGVFVDAERRYLYVSETFRRRVLRYPITAEGLGAMSVFVDIDAAAPAQRAYRTSYREAGPDGLEIGPDGNLYVAIYGEGRVLAFDPAGRFVREIATAERYVTNIAFDAEGGAIIVGSIANGAPPYPGKITYHPALARPQAG